MSYRCEKCRDLHVSRGVLCYQLRLLGSVVGRFQDGYWHPSRDDFMALQTLLYKMADKV